MSVANIGKLQENTAALCKKISQNVGRTYREASGEHRITVAKWLRNSLDKHYQRIRIRLTGEVETPSSPIRRIPDVRHLGGMVERSPIRTPLDRSTQHS
uniref:Uncharacterized protein n=1 Tax=Vitis vinifera TaxID=29760 RepID=A5AHL0_VITVI|nr:hypothetical protein VITISV_013699 [Vitis vinifera]